MFTTMWCGEVAAIAASQVYGAEDLGIWRLSAGSSLEV